MNKENHSNVLEMKRVIELNLLKMNDSQIRFNSIFTCEKATLLAYVNGSESIRSHSESIPTMMPAHCAAHL